MRVLESIPQYAESLKEVKFSVLYMHQSKWCLWVYGNYVEGLEGEAEAIYDYFGQDFITPRKKENPILFDTVPGTVRKLMVLSNQHL